VTTTEQRPTTATDHTPANLGAEQIVLGAMMLSKDAIGDIAAILEPADFYRPWHATIYRTILNQYAAGEPTDAVPVAERLATDRQFADKGGAAYLHTLIEAVPTAANGAYYARLVAEKAARRALIGAGTRIVQLATTAPADLDRPGDLADRASQFLYEAISRNDTGDLIPVGHLLTTTLEAIEEAGRTKGLRGLSTGFIDLDRLTGGLRPGQLVVIAGRPAMGKSVLATDVARHTALHAPYRPVAFFSLEMSNDELMNRLTAAETGVPLHAINEGRLSDSDWTKVARRYGEIENAPLYIDQTPHITLAEIRAKARRQAAREPLGLIVVDYLQLMATAGRSDSREREVAEISRGLKILAKEIGCPVIAVAQLNRGAEQRTDKRPMLSDLRESGAIEADADLVILLYREDYYDKESPRAGEADFIVAKNRGGPTDTITVASQLHLSRFADMAIA
jgi:replicative DNA helicase